MNLKPYMDFYFEEEAQIYEHMLPKSGDYPNPGEVWLLRDKKTLVLILQQVPLRGHIFTLQSWFACEKDIIVSEEENSLNIRGMVCTWLPVLLKTNMLHCPYAKTSYKLAEKAARLERFSLQNIPNMIRRLDDSIHTVESAESLVPIKVPVLQCSFDDEKGEETYECGPFLLKKEQQYNGITIKEQRIDFHNTYTRYIQEQLSAMDESNEREENEIISTIEIKNLNLNAAATENVKTPKLHRLFTNSKGTLYARIFEEKDFLLICEEAKIITKDPTRIEKIDGSYEWPITQGEHDVYLEGYGYKITVENETISVQRVQDENT